MPNNWFGTLMLFGTLNVIFKRLVCIFFYETWHTCACACVCVCMFVHVPGKVSRKGKGWEGDLTMWNFKTNFKYFFKVQIEYNRAEPSFSLNTHTHTHTHTHTKPYLFPGSPKKGLQSSWKNIGFYFISSFCKQRSWILKRLRVHVPGLFLLIVFTNWREIGPWGTASGTLFKLEKGDMPDISLQSSKWWREFK